MLDYLITGGLVADGTGSPARKLDLGVRGGLIAEVSQPGTITEAAKTAFDATELVVSPGFVDPHTHYDAQLFWDPFATPSNVHGVTSIIGGNCGFTLAPVKAADADYLRRMMAQVEGMPLPALEAGVPWSWTSFGEYLDTLNGALGVNAGFLVGHCALRRYVMGADAIGAEASSAQIDEMVAELHRSIEAGGLGFSTTMSRTHSDGDGQPVASRWATQKELIALCTAVGEHEGTTLEAIVDGCLDYFSDDETELLVAMSVAARRPINWNVLTVDSKRPDQISHQLKTSSRALDAGARIVALTMPVLVPMNMSFRNYCALNMLPDWGPILSLPIAERMAKLSEPETRRFMEERAHSEDAGVFGRLTDFGNYVLGDTYSEANEGLKGSVVADIAADRDMDPFDTLVDIVIKDDLRTVLWPIPTDGDDESWRMRQSLWEDPRAMIGGSDAGAHLDRMCGSSYTTRFLGDCLRGRKLATLERAVQLITSEPADLFGLRGRGRIATGNHADIVVFDPETIGAEHATLVSDLPGGASRLTAAATGVVRVLVNGVVTVENNAANGSLPGKILRSARDTDTVKTG